MANFLLEIGTEEVPARFLQSEEEQLADLFAKELEAAGLTHGEMMTMSTPRRLAIYIADVADSQMEREEIVTGPPARIAWDVDGQPTRALQGFLKTNNLALSDIFTTKTAKGEYVAARIKSGGKKAEDVLAEICPQIIGALAFPKSMRWGCNEKNYVRPMHWIVALLGDQALDFAFGPVQSGRQTRGHRVLGCGPFSIPNADEWKDILANEGGVVASSDDRKEKIIAQGDNLAAEKGGQVIWKDNLLREVMGLVENPVPLLGEFDAAYLEIPEEVLLTSMESHQKSFGIRGGDGKLLPYFLTVSNLASKDMPVVKKGWERVLRARLEDARFFWNTDRKDTFENWLKKLENVIFIGPLGSMGEKSRRLAQLCRWLAEQADPLNVEAAARAGALAKADLVSGMVGEFDTLQGIMGGIYAGLAGEDAAVAEAIKEQYLPAGPDTPLPQSGLGAILSIAARADTLAGCFGLDMIPGGMADPNGLRRCALGIIRILLQRNWDIKTGCLFDEARHLYGDRRWKLSEEEAREKLLAFMAGRLRNFLIGQGYDTLMVDSVLARGVDRIADCKARLDAMAAFASEDIFLNAARTLKRVANIAKKSEHEVKDHDWRDDLLREDAEKNLAGALNQLLPALDQDLEQGAYASALTRLENLREPVDRFFDQVMVNCDDGELRLNRFKLLNAINSRFAKIADFGQMQI